MQARMPSSAAGRLAAFATVLVAVFALTFVGARAFGPTPSGSAAPAEATHGGAEHGHETMPKTEASAVRGLSVEQDGYRLSGLSAPSEVAASGRLSFTLTGPGDVPVTAYDRSHEKDLHLAVVRTDGSQFSHVHPTTDGHGRWSLPWTWSAAGSYRVFADFVPTDLGRDVTLTSTVEVAGRVRSAADAPVDAVEVDGFTVRREGDVFAGQASTLTFSISRDDRPVTDLQPYLGAYGHLIALRSGDLAYLHVHPMGEPGDGTSQPGPEINFMAAAPTPGAYLLYLDFRADDAVHTAAFMITVRP